MSAVTLKITLVAEAKSFVSLPGSPPLACDHPDGQVQEERTIMTRRNDNYLPVPGEEKNLDVDFISKAKNNESIVRDCIFVILWEKR